MTETYPRDMIGYGRTTPDPHWPGGARICVQFVVNYEEGGENNILHGDAASEAFLSEIVGAAAWPGQRHWNMESIYEYGARAGFWRLWRLFTQPQRAGHRLRRGDRAGARPRADGGHEGGRLGDRLATAQMDRVQGHAARRRSASRSAEAIRLHTEVTGARPLGWYLGRCSMNTHAAGDGGGRLRSIPPTAMPTTCPTG